MFLDGWNERLIASRESRFGMKEVEIHVFGWME